MKCARARRFLSLFAGNDLSLRSADRVREHLKDCHACARIYASFREAGTALREGAVAPTPPADLWKRIEAAAVAEGRSPVPGMRRFSPLASRAAAAALALVLVGFGVDWARRSVAPESPGSDSGSLTPGRGVSSDGSGAPEVAGFLRKRQPGAPDFWAQPIGELATDEDPATAAGWRWTPAAPVLPFEVRPAAQIPARRDF